jgi:hypothetical protein
MIALPMKTLQHHDSFRQAFPLYKMKDKKGDEAKRKRRWVMNSLKRSNWMKYAALAVLAVSLGSGLANAQDIAGKFNLPFKARWDKLVLNPGNYSFTYGSITTGSARVITVYRGRRGVGMILTGPASEGQFSDSSHLTAVRVAGAYRITSLQLSDQGITLHFTMPRSEVLEAAQVAQLARNLPVLRASK